MNDIFKALKDPTRREILRLLRDEPLSAGTIAERFTISRPSISHHLEILRNAELVDVERRGQFLFYRLNATVLEGLLQWVLEMLNDENPSL